MTAARRAAATGLVAVGALLLAGAGLAAPSAEAAVGCDDAQVALATGIALSCSIAGAPAQPHDPDAGTRTYTVGVDLTAPGTSVDVVVANDTVFQPVSADTAQPQDTVDEVVSSMVGRTGATVGVNGGYFDIFQGGETPYTGSVCGGTVIDGEIWKSPPVGDSPDETAQLDTALYEGADGALRVDHVDFAGAVTLLDAGAPVDSRPLAGVNDITTALPVPRCPSSYLKTVSAGEGIALLTPRLGAALLNPGPGAAPGFTVPDTRQVALVTATPVAAGGDVYTVETAAVTAGISAIPAVAEGQVALLGSGSDLTTPGGWLATLQPGQTVRIQGGLTVDGLPAPGIRTLLGGVAQIVAGGAPVAEPVGFVPPSTPGDDKHAETVVGLDATGRQVTVLAIDRSDGSPGVWWQQAATLLAGTGVQSAILFDGGGSTTLAAALPGQGGQVAVVDTPEGDNVLSGPDGQRYVGDALVFTGAPLPAPAPAPTPVLPATGAAGPAPAAAAAAGAALVALGVVVSRRRSAGPTRGRVGRPTGGRTR